MYKNILVGYDESIYSKEALNEASFWVKKHGGKILIVHAVFFNTEEFSAVPEQIEKRTEIGKKICYMAKETLTTQGIDAESVICEGEPHDVIIEIAKARAIDLIVLGTYGRRGLKRLLMGSVTSSVIIDSPCDILVVRKRRPDTEGYRNIVLPFDGSPYSKKSLNRAFEISRLEGAEINVLYVIPRYEEMVEFFKTDGIRKSLFAEAEKILSIAKNMADDKGVAIKTNISEGNPSDEIIKFSELNKSDLIIMGPYGYKGIDKAIIGSTTERVIASSICPVLCVR